MGKILLCKLLLVPNLILFSIGCYSQSKDDYVKPFENFKQDSVTAINLSNRIDSLYNNENIAEASKLIEQAIPVFENFGFKDCIANAQRTQGDIYRITDNYIKAIESLSLALEYYQKTDNCKEIASIQNRMGAVFRLQGDYPTALEHYFEALKNYQSINFKQGISRTLNNIGIVYTYQNDYNKALEYYFNTLNIELELNNENGIGISYLNIGVAYKAKDDNKKAIDFLLKSLVISKKQNDICNIGVSYNEIGSTYIDLGNLSQAKHYLDEALKTFQEIGSKSRQAECHIYYGQYLDKAKQPMQAVNHFKKAIELAIETGAKDIQSNALDQLSKFYENNNNPVLALKYFKDHISIKDSIFSKENTTRAVQAELLYQFEKKQEAIKLEQSKKDAITIEKSKQQKVFRNFLITIISLLIILISFVLSAYRNKQKANKILASQQNEILEKNEELVQQQEEIVTQRDEIEQKNRILEQSQQIIAAKNERIISSIEYAQTIQQAILPHEDQLSKFFDDHFVVFLPKDIVSGDFFWVSSYQDFVFAAVIDCTGHGVPGSFMSLIGNTILNQIVNEWHTHDPALILEYLHEKIRKALQQDEIHSKAHASMDICLVKFNPKNRKATFAGANRPLYVVQDNTLVKYPGDMKSVGGFQRETKRFFTNHEIHLSSNSLLYLTTDGFVDQMNPDKRKIGPKQLLKILEENSNKPLAIQRDILLHTLSVYSNGEEQIDDICILGIKV